MDSARNIYIAFARHKCRGIKKKVGWSHTYLKTDIPENFLCTSQSRVTHSPGGSHVHASGPGPKPKRLLPDPVMCACRGAAPS